VREFPPAPVAVQVFVTRTSPGVRAHPGRREQVSHANDDGADAEHDRVTDPGVPCHGGGADPMSWSSGSLTPQRIPGSTPDSRLTAASTSNVNNRSCPAGSPPRP